MSDIRNVQKYRCYNITFVLLYYMYDCKIVHLLNAGWYDCTNVRRYENISRK